MTRKTEDTGFGRGQRSSSRAGVGAFLVIAAAAQIGCAGSTSNANSPGGGLTKRDTAVVHEACDTNSGGTEKIDANGDGRADIFIVRDGGREVCRAVDLNFDGVIDAYSYFDASGQLRRRENDYDKDGQVDEISVFKAGQIAEKDQATAVAKRLDTWDFYQAGVLTRTERDSNGDGIVDQWWEYPQPGCPLIHADVNNDGRPDPGATIDYCKETGYVPPERAADKTPASPTFDQKGTLPTELDNKPAAGGDASKPADAKPAETKPADAKPAAPKGTGK